MNEFIEKNERLLKSYCLIAQISGLLLVMVPLVGTVIEISTGSFFRGGGPYGPEIIQFSFAIQALLNVTFLGLVALVVAQFIKYVFESQDRSGLILRIGDKILYVYAALIILGVFSKWVFQMVIIEAITPLILLTSFIALILPAVVKALILIGLGRILRRIIPVIEESKTLV